MIYGMQIGRAYFYVFPGIEEYVNLLKERMEKFIFENLLLTLCFVVLATTGAGSAKRKRKELTEGQMKLKVIADSDRALVKI